MKISKKNYTPKFRWRFEFSTFFLTILMMFLLSIPILPLVKAGGQDATFDSVEVVAVPSVQGVGGEITLEVKANFFGGCCYHLYAYDVQAELSVPENVQIVNDFTETFKTVDAIPGGQASSVKFKWIITSNTPGIYELEVKVSTANCGSREAKYQITLVEGASISNPTIFPSKSSVDEDLTFSAIIRSGNDFVSIKDATLYVWRNSNDYDRNILKAENDKIYKMDVDSQTIDKNNNTDQQTDEKTNEYLGTGTAYPMTHVEFSEVWRARLTDVENEEFLYYWFKVETSDNKNITTEVYEQQIIDYQKKTQMLSSTIWSTLGIVIIGVILILTLTWKFIGKYGRKSSIDGIFILGSTIFSKPIEGKKENISYITSNQLRSAFLIVLIILTISLLTLSIYLGLFQELISETGG